MALSKDSFANRKLRQVIGRIEISFSDTTCTMEFFPNMDALQANNQRQETAIPALNGMIAQELGANDIRANSTCRFISSPNIASRFLVHIAREDHDKAIAFAEDFSNRKFEDQLKLKHQR